MDAAMSSMGRGRRPERNVVNGITRSNASLAITQSAFIDVSQETPINQPQLQPQQGYAPYTHLNSFQQRPQPSVPGMIMAGSRHGSNLSVNRFFHHHQQHASTASGKPQRGGRMSEDDFNGDVTVSAGQGDVNMSLEDIRHLRGARYGEGAGTTMDSMSYVPVMTGNGGNAGGGRANSLSGQQGQQGPPMGSNESYRKQQVMRKKMVAMRYAQMNNQGGPRAMSLQSYTPGMPQGYPPNGSSSRLNSMGGQGPRLNSMGGYPPQMGQVGQMGPPMNQMGPGPQMGPPMGAGPPMGPMGYPRSMSMQTGGYAHGPSRLGPMGPPMGPPMQGQMGQMGPPMQGQMGPPMRQGPPMQGQMGQNMGQMGPPMGQNMGPPMGQNPQMGQMGPPMNQMNQNPQMSESPQMNPQGNFSRPPYGNPGRRNSAGFYQGSPQMQQGSPQMQQGSPQMSPGQARRASYTQLAGGAGHDPLGPVIEVPDAVQGVADPGAAKRRSFGDPWQRRNSASQLKVEQMPPVQEPVQAVDPLENTVPPPRSAQRRAPPDMGASRNSQASSGDSFETAPTAFSSRADVQAQPRTAAERVKSQDDSQNTPSPQPTIFQPQRGRVKVNRYVFGDSDDEDDEDDQEDPDKDTSPSIETPPHEPATVHETHVKKAVPTTLSSNRESAFSKLSTNGSASTDSIQQSRIESPVKSPVPLSVPHTHPVDFSPTEEQSGLDSQHEMFPDKKEESTRDASDSDSEPGSIQKSTSIPPPTPAHTFQPVIPAFVNDTQSVASTSSSFDDESIRKTPDRNLKNNTTSDSLSVDTSLANIRAREASGVSLDFTASPGRKNKTIHLPNDSGSSEKENVGETGGSVSRDPASRDTDSVLRERPVNPPADKSHYVVRSMIPEHLRRLTPKSKKKSVELELSPLSTPKTRARNSSGASGATAGTAGSRPRRRPPPSFTPDSSRVASSASSAASGAHGKEHHSRSATLTTIENAFTKSPKMAGKFFKKIAERHRRRSSAKSFERKEEVVPEYPPLPEKALPVVPPAAAATENVDVLPPLPPKMQSQNSEDGRASYLPNESLLNYRLTVHLPRDDESAQDLSGMLDDNDGVVDMKKEEESPESPTSVSGPPSRPEMQNQIERELTNALNRRLSEQTEGEKAARSRVTSPLDPGTRFDNPLFSPTEEKLEVFEQPEKAVPVLQRKPVEQPEKAVEAEPQAVKPFVLKAPPETVPEVVPKTTPHVDSHPEEKSLSPTQSSAISSLVTPDGPSAPDTAAVAELEEYLEPGQLGILNDTNDLIKELQVVSTELAGSISRELTLESKLKSGAAVSAELVQKTQTGSRIAELIEKLMEERRKRYAAEELLLRKAHGVSDSAQLAELGYKNSALQRRIVELEEELRSNKTRVDILEDDRNKLKTKLDDIGGRYRRLTNETLPGLKNQLEILTNAKSPENSLEEQFEQLRLENQSLKQSKLSESDEATDLRSQMDSLREALQSMKARREADGRINTERINTQERTINRLSSLNAELSRKLVAAGVVPRTGLSGSSSPSLRNNTSFDQLSPRN